MTDTVSYKCNSRLIDSEHASIRKQTDLGVTQSHRLLGCVSVNTRPHQLHWDDRQMETSISCKKCSQVAGHMLSLCVAVHLIFDVISLSCPFFILTCNTHEYYLIPRVYSTVNFSNSEVVVHACGKFYATCNC